MATTVAVLGGGISGLSAAYYLSRLAAPGTQILLIEGSSRLGGWIRSERASPGILSSSETSKGQEVLFEAGPRGLRPQGVGGALLLDMIKDLGLTNDILCVNRSDPSAKHRYIYYKDSINVLPSSLSDLVFRKPPIFKSVIPASLREMFIRRPTTDQDETLFDFTKRRFNEHIALNLIGSLAHGIYAGDAKQLSTRSTLTSLYENERVYGSVVKGMLRGGVVLDTFRERGMAARARDSDPAWFAEHEKLSVLGFRDGTAMLTRALEQRLRQRKNVKLLLNDPIEQIHISDNGGACKITTGTGEQYAEHVISALPSKQLDGLLRNKPLPHLTHNPSVDVAVVNLAYPTSEIQFNYDGFGVLMPHRDGPTRLPVPGTLGVVFDSNAMQGQDGQDITKFTVMLGGSDWADTFSTPIHQLDPRDAFMRAKKAMQAYLGIAAEPSHARVHLQRQCIPQYTVGHHQRMLSLHHELQTSYGHLLSLTGASYLSVSVPDCIKNSRALVEELVVSGALGSRAKYVTGLGKLDGESDTTLDSTNIGKSHVAVLLRS